MTTPIKPNELPTTEAPDGLVATLNNRYVRLPEEFTPWAQAEEAADRAEAIGTFDSRADLVTWRASNAPVNGRSYFFSGTALRGSTGATILPSLGDMRPVGNIANADHLGLTLGAVSDAVALTNAQRINAWLAAADCNIFDCRADQIGIGETIRLGRDGNGLLGVPTAGVFGLPTTGAVLKFQGTAGGTAVMCRPTSNTADLKSPSVFGVTVDANSLAGAGFTFEGCMKPLGDMLHVRNLRDNAGSWGFIFRHNPDHTGADVNCCYGGRFGQLTVHAGGAAANGFLFSGKPSASGQAVTFCQFSYLHFTGANGYSVYCEKGDDVVIDQIGVSRSAGGTNAAFAMITDTATSKVWVGNVIHNMNLSKSDGLAIQIVTSGTGAMGNIIQYNGVDFAPTLVFASGATRNMNRYKFLGQSNYSGGWTAEPFQNLFPLPNVDDPNSKILDWYEEGTFTPTIAFGGASVGITYSLQTGTWTRIGNRCHVQLTVAISAKGSSTGGATINGLPFASSASGGGAAFTFYTGLAVGATPMGAAGGTAITLRKAGGTAAVDMTDADFTATTRFDLQLTYRVA